ncbi:MAG: glycosyltransferase [Candidatus Omnitrophica bacterium]|nr:glycosyltransferase [Candidatus Omnitrophota bacterium]
MNILMPTSSYPLPSQPSWGPFVRETALALADHGHKVTLLIFSPNNQRNEYLEAKNSRVRVIAYPYLVAGKPVLHCSVGLIPSLRKSPLGYLQIPSYVVSSAIEILKAIREYEIDLIHAMWYLPMGFISTLLKPLHKKPVVVTGLGADLHLANNFLTRSFLQFTAKHADRNIVCSKYLEEKALSYGIPPNTFNVIPNGVCLDHFVVHRRVACKGTVRIGCAKRLIPEKNLQDLILAVKSLPDELLNIIEVFIAGDGPISELLHALIQAYGLSHKIHLIGDIPHQEIPKFLSGIDIVVDTSTQEGLATSNIEALASGCILIAPDGYGNRELVQHTVNGFLYKARNVEDLASLLSQVIQDVNETKEWSQKAFDSIQTRFDVKVVAHHLSEVYARVLEA